MKLFASRASGRAVTAGYVAMIYLTLGVVGSFQLWLRDTGWQTPVSTAILVFSISAALYIVVIRQRRRSAMNLVALAGAGFMYAYLMTTFSQNPSSRIHLVEYSLLAILLYYTLRFDVKNKSAYVLAWVITTFIGFVDEVIQAYLPTRAYDLDDLMINTMAAAIALCVVGVVVEDEK
ncbi:hypothetical protein MNBD_NITROSPINAE04-124 [hydrothermal vent metagenome]|uniref:VanZ-like domain-containing protein n=1 Tax=hydrothermal vent metagenome TaxID=652676 RepID=A0A3B1BTR2_9ZZZZ